MTPTERKALSQQVRQERQAAVAERRRQEALHAPTAGLPASPVRQQEAPAHEPPRHGSIGLTGIFVHKPTGKPPTAPSTCRRSRWQDYPDTHVACPSGAPRLHVVYAMWTEHHATCPICSWQDWYTPGGVKEVHDPLLADVTLLHDGQPRYFRHGVDYTVLCAEGAALFQQWEREAAKGWGNREGTT